MMETTDAYEILGVPRGATQEQIRRAYLRLSRQVHSDTGGSDGLFRQVKWAYDTLADPPASARFDPPHGEGAEGPHPYHEDVPPDQAEKTGEPSSPQRVWLRANPSLALFLFGIAAFILDLRSGASASLVTPGRCHHIPTGTRRTHGSKANCGGDPTQSRCCSLEKSIEGWDPSTVEQDWNSVPASARSINGLGFYD